MKLEPIDLSEARAELSKLPRKAPERRRSFYSAAQQGRLTLDWVTSILSADKEMQGDLQKLRGRARDLSRNYSLARKFLAMVTSNVVGHRGIILQAKVRNLRGEGLKEQLNDAIEKAWHRWSRRGICTVEGRLSFADAQRLAIRTVALDGECLVRKVPYPNEFGFALQFLDADQLDHNFQGVDRTSGNEIRMGVEVDRYGRPAAYWLYDKHPSEFSSGPRERKRVPASEVLHLFITDRVGQSRGVPWMAASMFDMNMLRGYKEAEIVAARTAAAKMGFLETTISPEAGYTGEPNEDGTTRMEASPGTIDVLPPGSTFKEWDPTHPTTAFGPFVKSCLRDVASGLLVDYNGLANDLEGVNYSSIRAGLLETREIWKLIQCWFIEQFMKPVFETWLEFALLSGQVPVSARELDICEQITWHARRWPWVDPEKDIRAAKEAIGSGLDTWTDVLAEDGKDFEETIDELASNLEYLRSKGLELPLALAGGAAKPAEEEEESDEGAGKKKPEKPAEEEEGE
jgi:lambda family phage portal protein